MAYDWNQALMDYAGATLKDKKIIVPRQAAFKTSNRYYRGQILKILVRQHTATTQELWDYFSVQNPIEKQRLDTIFAQLIKEGILQREGDKISIR